MRIQVTVVFGIVLLYALTAFAEKKIHAPLPDKVVSAKTIFFINESGTARFGDDLYRQIKAWNRWEVVGDREKADLVLVLSPSDTVPVVMTTSSARTGENLWRADASMGGKLWRSWGSIAKSLLSDIQQRLQ
jgi:hypothetical protein